MYNYIGVIRKLALHMYILLLSVYLELFQPGLLPVTVTDPSYPVACDPLGLDPITQK